MSQWARVVVVILTVRSPHPTEEGEPDLAVTTAVLETMVERALAEG